MKTNIGLIGFGTVGEAFYNQAQSNPSLRIKRIAVKDLSKPRGFLPLRLTDDAYSLLEDPSIPIVVEAIDDEDAAFAYADIALRAGKTYITASKKMVANRLQELIKLQETKQGSLYYEAAVGGAIPVLRTINEHLRNEPIERIRGILNGSCNFILTRMEQGRLSFDDALQLAQDLGFAESDPTLDIDGWDTYYKSILLAFTGFREIPNLKAIRWTGIRSIDAAAIGSAKKRNQKIKLIADISNSQEGIVVNIGPERITPDDPLFSINNEINGIVITGKYSGDLLLQGPGAGGNPTASAMMGDLSQALSSRWATPSWAALGIH